MLDILLLRKDLASAVARLETRKKPQAFLNVEAFQALESERKTIQMRTEELQSQRNQLSKQIGMLMGKGEKDAAEAAKAAYRGQAPHLAKECGTDIALITSGKLAADLGIPQLNPETDRALLCGSMRMLADTSKILDDLGFQVSPSMGVPGHYAIERAFVDQ